MSLLTMTTRFKGEAVMTSLVIEKKQENGRYKADGLPVTDPVQVYRSLSYRLLKKVNRSFGRFEYKEFDNEHLRLVFTYYDWRIVYIVPQF